VVAVTDELDEELVVVDELELLEHPAAKAATTRRPTNAAIHGRRPPVASSASSASPIPPTIPFTSDSSSCSVPRVCSAAVDQKDTRHLPTDAED
jgi:hypothetical protein